MENLVVIMGDEIYTDTYEIAVGVGSEHQSVIKLVKSNLETDIFRGLSVSKKRLKKKEANVYFLDELQATFLITLMKNSPKVLEFKRKLVSEFFKQRKLISQMVVQKQNQEWLEKRNKTKVMRKELTDTIQEFIAYAKNQGSKSAEHYYSNFTRMELTGLFLLEQKYPNARDLMSARQLNLIEMADEAVARTLRECMDEKIHYKECYERAKNVVVKLAELFPKSPLPQLLLKQGMKNE